MPEIDLKNPRKDTKRYITVNFKKWGVTLLIIYLCITSFLTALYLQDTRLKISVGTATLLK